MKGLGQGIKLEGLASLTLANSSLIGGCVFSHQPIFSFLPGFCDTRYTKQGANAAEGRGGNRKRVKMAKAGEHAVYILITLAGLLVLPPSVAKA